MATPQDVAEETLPGRDVWSLLADTSFLALSGRPGSGKTTLVQATILELCGEHSSSLRAAMAGEHGIAPLPIILRTIPAIDTITTLEQLLDAWWREEQKDAAAEGITLDTGRLRQWFDAPTDAPADAPADKRYPLLILFDGIDEVGGIETRSRIYALAQDAHQRGHRVLITGRPAGFHALQTDDLPQSTGPAMAPLNLHYLLPLAWEQIRQFIHQWYQLRGEWRKQRDRGIAQFLDAMRDSQRAYLLVLARRPIFISLMALVHCTQNQMPDGRAQLYSTIIELYLGRQERHRQLRFSVSGSALPHWPDQEKRMVLGYLAWQSQLKSADVEGAYETGNRRVIWRRKEMLEQIRSQLQSGHYGRFAAIKAGDADKLLDYFLHPSGLLVEPAEARIQFAHLSFQEYLCADFLFTLGGRRLQKTLEDRLLPNLHKPGWDEVGILLLAIMQENDNRGHFELLGWLDLAQVDQASLFIQAYTGNELSFTDQEREQWLPLAMAACLLHPPCDFVESLARRAELAEPGRALLHKLLTADSLKAAWQPLQQALETDTPWGIDDVAQHPMAESMLKCWKHPKDGNSWDVLSGEAEAHANGLLSLLNGSGWVTHDDRFNRKRQRIDVYQLL